SEAISDPELDVRAIALVGAALAHLHAQTPDKLVCLTREAEATTLCSLSANLSCILPHLAVRLGQLTRRLGSDLLQAQQLTDSIHGDFGPKQVLLGDNTVPILDLDRAVSGDPALDLGLFIAYLERASLDGTLAADRLAALSEAFIDGYCSVTRRPIPAHVPLY